MKGRWSQICAIFGLEMIKIAALLLLLFFIFFLSSSRSAAACCCAYWGSYQGGTSVALAVGVSDIWQVTCDT